MEMSEILSDVSHNALQAAQARISHQWRQQWENCTSTKSDKQQVIISRGTHLLVGWYPISSWNALRDVTSS